MINVLLINLTISVLTESYSLLQQIEDGTNESSVLAAPDAIFFNLFEPSVLAAPDAIFFTLFYLFLKSINYEEFSTWYGTMVFSYLS